MSANAGVVVPMPTFPFMNDAAPLVDLIEKLNNPAVPSATYATLLSSTAIPYECPEVLTCPTLYGFVGSEILIA